MDQPLRFIDQRASHGKHLPVRLSPFDRLLLEGIKERRGITAASLMREAIHAAAREEGLLVDEKGATLSG